MYPRTDAQSGFKYPDERLLELRGILAEERMRHPDTKDHDGKNCLYVIKRGLATLTTIGRATGFFSCAREYFANQTHQDSTESSDATYATPMFWLWLIIKAKFPNANLSPVFN
jgi:hypothetical protein